MTSLNFNNIETLIGSNFKKWKEDVEIVLSLMDLDLALREEKPQAITAEIEEKFKESEKAETGTFPTQITSMKYDGVGSVREHILKMVDLAQKLKDLEVPMTDQFLVHMALNSLPPKYGQLKVSYNTQKDKWGIDELISSEDLDLLGSKRTFSISMTDCIPKTFLIG
ncbi:unnamed protein product [Malus baccata var. baccata]